VDIDDGRSREDEQSEDDGENRDQAITDLTLPDEDEEDDVDEDDSQDALVSGVGWWVATGGLVVVVNSVSSFNYVSPIHTSVSVPVCVCVCVNS